MMKELFISIVLGLTAHGFADAQTPLSELEKIKRIKLLASTREEVRRIFAGDQDFNVLDDASSYSTENLQVNIFYASGNCSAAEGDDWNVPEGTVVNVKVYFGKRSWATDLSVDLSALKKEHWSFVLTNRFPIYFDKSAGVKYEVCDGKIVSIEFFPPKEKLPLLCRKKKEKRKFYQSERWSREKVKEPDWNFVDYFAGVSRLTLSSHEITAGCNAGNSGCAQGGKLIDVFAEIETSTCIFDEFIFNYRVTGGKIVGEGDKVVWDLSGVKPGTYTITASVDPGCGICGSSRTETIVVR